MRTLAAMPCRARGDLVGMAAAGVVVVGQDADGESLEVPVQFLRPLVGAAGVAGGDEAEARQPIDVLLALDDENGIIGGVRPQLEQPIGHLADALDAPGPASLAVRTALAEVLRLVADDLEQQLSGLVAVVVGGDDPPPSAVAGASPRSECRVPRPAIRPPRRWTDRCASGRGRWRRRRPCSHGRTTRRACRRRSRWRAIRACRSAAARASTARGSARRAGRGPHPRSAH